MHPYTLINAIITPYKANPTVTYPIYIGVFSCQDPEETTFKLQLLDNLGNLLDEKTGSAPSVSSPILVGFSAPGKAGYQAKLYTKCWFGDFLTDLGGWPTVKDTSPGYRTRAIYSGHSLSSLFPKAGSIVSFTLSAQNVGRDGWLNAAIHGRDLYTLSELIAWTFGGWRYLYPNQSTSWTWRFIMPDADLILDFLIYVYDWTYEYIIDYLGYVATLYEDSPRTLTLSSDKAEVKKGETFTLSGEAKRGGKPLARHPVWIYKKVGSKWYPLTWVATNNSGVYSVSLSGDQFASGDNVFKAVGVPTWAGYTYTKLGFRFAKPPVKLPALKIKR
jgi:hypothetical protein